MPEYFNGCYFLMSVNIHNPTNRPVRGLKRPNNLLQVPNNGRLVMILVQGFQKEVVKPYFFEKQEVTAETYKRILRRYGFLKLVEYPEDNSF